MPHLDTDDLRITFKEIGARSGKPVLLLHGWPDDATTWEAIVDLLKDRHLRLSFHICAALGRRRF